jgi:hypothetical protein
MLLREIIDWLWGSEDERDHVRQRFRYWRQDFKITGKHLFWAYCLVGLYTFGHCATNYPVMDWRNWGEEDRSVKRKDNFSTAFQASVAGTAWPAYWVWEYMDDGNATG